MNTPNKLTVFRIILAPVFLALFLADDLPHHYLFALVVFVVASLTDLLDGKIARKYDLITDFGKFLDPLADKMLICAALIGLLAQKICSPWVVMIILTRDFLVNSLRMVAAGSGTVIAANMWGKVKTTSQMTAVIFTIAVQELAYILTDAAGLIFALQIVCQVLLWAATLLTLISGANYLWINRKFVDPTK